MPEPQSRGAELADRSTDPVKADKAGRFRAEQRAAWFLLALLLAMLCVARISHVEVDDDTSYLAYLGVPPSTTALAVESLVEQKTASTPDCAFAHFRIAFRDRYAENYSGYSAATAAFYQSARAAGVSHVGSLAAAGFGVKTIAFALAAGLLLFISARTRNAQLRTALALAITGLALADLVADSGLVRTFWIVNIGSPAKTILEIAYSLVIAHRSHSPFGLTPRNVALTMFAIALILRWQRRYIAAALVVFAIGFVHQTYGGLSLFLFTLSGAVSQPDALRPWAARFALTAAGLLYVIRESYAGPAFARPLFCIALLVIAGIGFSVAGSAAYLRMRKAVLRRFANSRVKLDALSIAAISLLISVACVVGGQGADPIQRLYFWGDLTIRIWSFARVPLFVVVALVFVRTASLSQRQLLVCSATLALCATIGFSALVRPDPVQRFEQAESTLLASDGRHQSIRFPENENWLYAHLAAISGGLENGVDFAREVRARPLTCDNPLRK